MALPSTCVLSLCNQARPPILANRLELREACATLWGDVRAQEATRAERTEGGHQRCGWRVGRDADHLHRFHIPTAPEHRELAEEPLFPRTEQPITPVEGGAERPLAFRQIGGSLHQ